MIYLSILLYSRRNFTVDESKKSHSIEFVNQKQAGRFRPSTTHFFLDFSAIVTLGHITSSDQRNTFLLQMMVLCSRLTGIEIFRRRKKVNEWCFRDYSSMGLANFQREIHLTGMLDYVDIYFITLKISIKYRGWWKHTP